MLKPPLPVGKTPGRPSDLSGRPTGVRVVVRRERPHPVAQLRFADADGVRLTAFATNTVDGQSPGAPDRDC